MGGRGGGGGGKGGGGGGGAASSPAPAAATPVSQAAQTLMTAATREEGRAALQSLSTDELRQVAEQVRVPLTAKNRSKGSIITSLIEGTVGHRVDAFAIRGNATLPY